ncbi:hypothetical protein EDC04DRAFT_2610826 [Pisolithus marmoratus]|nr:hypothetical protein EDC04DRAFT_2610826 [Pisolithus marmoratus]
MWRVFPDIRSLPYRSDSMRYSGQLAPSPRFPSRDHLCDFSVATLFSHASLPHAVVEIPHAPPESIDLCADIQSGSIMRSPRVIIVISPLQFQASNRQGGSVMSKFPQVLQLLFDSTVDLFIRLVDSEDCSLVYAEFAVVTRPSSGSSVTQRLVPTTTVVRSFESDADKWMNASTCISEGTGTKIKVVRITWLGNGLVWSSWQIVFMVGYSSGINDSRNLHASAYAATP